MPFAFVSAPLFTGSPLRSETPQICSPRPHLHRPRFRAAIDASAPTANPPITVSDMSTSPATYPTIFDVEQIMNILPHRYPFLLIDRVIAYEPNKRAVAVKQVTINEPHFPGHFPNRPIMPGVLQVEALAQTGGIVMLQHDENPIKQTGEGDFFFGGVDSVKWRKPVVPGDTLVMEMVLDNFKPKYGIAKMIGKGYVNGQLVVEGIFTLVMVVKK